MLKHMVSDMTDRFLYLFLLLTKPGMLFIRKNIPEAEVTAAETFPHSASNSLFGMAFCPDINNSLYLI